MLDGMLGQLLGGLSGRAEGGAGSNAVVQMALQLLEQNGGISGVVDKLRQAGYGRVVDSWVGTGANEPIAPDALQQALGPAPLRALATRLGIPHDDATDRLAGLLPQIVDKLTPQGSIPANHQDLIAQALSLLQQGRPA